MKNYEEVTKNVFRKSKELIARNERRRNIIMTIGASACCLAAVCGVGVIAWNRARNTIPVEPAAQLVSEDYANSPGTSDTVVPENSGASDGEDVISPELMAFMSHTFVRGFEVEDDEEKVAPDNGQIHISKALQAAMDKYGDVDENGKIFYDVVFTYLQDGKTIPSTDEIYKHEYERWCKEKFSHGLNSVSSNNANGEETEYWIFANLTKSEIESFTADPNYGYVLELHENYHGYTITKPCTELESHGIASKVIRGFEVEGSEEKVAPDNGQIHISKALNAAMENYSYWGDEISYYVVITYFQDRHTIVLNEELCGQELKRFEEQLDLGFIDSFAPICGPNHEQMILAHLTKSEIKRFTADPNYGYAIELHDENERDFPTTEHPNSENIHHEDDHANQTTNSNSGNIHHEDDHANQTTNSNSGNIHHEDDHANQTTNSNSGNAHHNNHHG